MTGEEDGARRVDGDRGGARWPALGFRGRGPARRSSAGAGARVPGRGGRGRGARAVAGARVPGTGPSAEEQYSSAKRTPKNQKTRREDEVGGVFIEALPRRAV